MKTNITNTLSRLPGLTQATAITLSMSAVCTAGYYILQDTFSHDVDRPDSLRNINNNIELTPTDIMSDRPYAWSDTTSGCELFDLNKSINTSTTTTVERLPLR